MMLMQFVFGVALLLPSAVPEGLVSLMTSKEVSGPPAITELLTLPAPSTISCGVLCLERQECSWYVRNGSTHTCSLYREYIPADITPHVFDQHFTGTIFGVNRVMQCSPPPPIANGAVSAASHEEGDVAYYTCDTDYTFCRGVSKTTVCDASGQWQGVPGECGRYRLTDLSGSYIFLDLPCPLETGDSITWTGIPTSEQVFNVDLHGPLGRLLHIHVRFNVSGFHNKTVIAEQINGTWQTHSINTYFPFQVGKLFRIVAVVEDTLFRVHIDGQELGTLVYGTVLPQIDKLGFEQYVDARSAEIHYA
ncbi:uncharacterized protein LOC124270477 [Haliotis rubra]|uniref:uncharacterized protein LOC124270477 n=1 Tax=Haliotis rubra TaxID=36100 RepID=UPI001EE51463|nr:uncharacterized protein LOC124270477 [Haliotis rubra]